MIHIVKSTGANHRNSFGVSFDLLAIGPQSMVTKMRYRKHSVIPFHSHPNEQSGYILSGRIRALTADSKHELGPGDTYAIPGSGEFVIQKLFVRRECFILLARVLTDQQQERAKLESPTRRGREVPSLTRRRQQQWDREDSPDI